MKPRSEQLPDREPTPPGITSPREGLSGQPAAGRAWAGSPQSQAWEAFARDLDELLRTHRGKWVAYRGPQRVCVCDSEPDVYRECLKRGLPVDELFIDRIYPAATEVPEVFLPPSEGPLPDQSS
ncbi:MAG TPA: hypothetical protein VKA46_05085 [Gemmataceae bacterium]|nr:hypothetical protein [Gemmataceae bacterium]